MALRYGSKNASTLRYNSFNASTLRYNSHSLSMGDSSSYLTFILLDDGTYSVKAKDIYNMPEDVTIPSIYNGKAVTQIAEDAFFRISSATGELIGCTTIKTITIPDSVTSIGAYAFKFCSNLNRVTLGNSVASIGIEAFSYCTSLVDIVIPDSVTSVGGYAFCNCTNLTNVKIGENVTSIGGDAFRDCISLIDINIPNGVIEIDSSTFYGCSSLIDIYIPDSVTIIDFNAFESCTNLTTIYIPASVTQINHSVFKGCTNLTIYSEHESKPSYWFEDDYSNWNPENCPVVWGYTYTSSEYFTFTEQADGTYSVKATDVSNLPSEIGIPYSYNGKAVTVIDGNAFENSNITKVVIPNTVTTIKSYAFSGCGILPTIVIPINVATMEHYVFFNCHALSIYCEVDSQPEGWSSGYVEGTSISIEWNPDNRPVVWGYTS